MRALWLLAALTGCVRSASVPCDDGRLCPADTVCVEGGCAQVGACGDGHVDPGEGCDDGNLIAGDGCSEVCKAEVCGDGMLDVNEQCDDGNALSHDGCSSGCLLETPVWTPYTGTPKPELRRGHVMAWDPDHGVGVMHGGTGSMVLADTWLWNGSWQRVADGPDRTFHTIAWDRAGHLVMFGGADQGAVRRGETFAWDGAAWSMVGGTAATGRFDHVMGPDVVPGQLVMYGGIDSTGVNVETWVRDTNGWRELPNMPNGVRSQGVRFTWDPVRQRLISGGGNAGNHATFSWDGAAWTSLQDEGFPRTDHVQDYDPVRRRIVAFSGFTGEITNQLDEFDGALWSRVRTDTAPPARQRAAGFYDPIRHELVVFGGQSGAQFLDDTWTMRWTSATPDDACDGTDLDGDGKVGCDDPDCWARCTPRCPPGAPCAPGEPTCGDGVCNQALETPQLCPADC